MRRRREQGKMVGDEGTGDNVPKGGTQARCYIVEADAYELPEFLDRFDTLIPAMNQGFKKNIFVEGGRSWYPPDWYGGAKSWEDARKLIEDGWPEGAARTAKLAAKLREKLPDPESVRRRLTWSDEGFELDRDRLYAGNMDRAYRTTKAVRQRAPRVVRIVGNWAMSCGRSADNIMWNGTALAALADLLETADYQTEISLACPTDHYERGLTMPVIRVKAAADPVNLSSIAAVAGHAGIYRSFGFLAITSADFKTCDSLGTCLEVVPAWNRAVELGAVEPVDILLETMGTESEAVKGITEALTKLFAEEVEP